uniref:Uncharacterized protein n=1 Tax=Rhizophora mucronata TaxID=61149 RepID=A0A2P2Q7H5_RHIMU
MSKMIGTARIITKMKPHISATTIFHAYYIQ